MGNVHIQNLKGEQFDTELLYWDQRAQKNLFRVYPYQQPDRIITGHGFESNQQMTDYTIRKPEWYLLYLTRRLPQQTALQTIASIDKMDTVVIFLLITMAFSFLFRNGDCLCFVDKLRFEMERKSGVHFRYHFLFHATRITSSRPCWWVITSRLSFMVS